MPEITLRLIESSSGPNVARLAETFVAVAIALKMVNLDHTGFCGYTLTNLALAEQ